MHEHGYKLVGLGLYTVPEAARLTHVSAQRIRRWVKGYTYKVADEVRASEVVWTPQLPKIDDSVAISFLDLMEIRFINAFLDFGVSWRTVRLAAERAKELFERDHPFSTQQFKTDGKTIFAQILDHRKEPALLDLVRKQYAFHRVVSQSLYAGLDFSQDDHVVRWWPIGRNKSVVVDPKRSFGQPIVRSGGVPTAILASAYSVEGSFKRVASWYSIEPKAVREAVQFERQLAN